MASSFREVMKEVDKAKYCEYIDLYSLRYEGREDESCPNKAVGKCLHCKKRFCAFHGDRTVCYDCKRNY